LVCLETAPQRRDVIRKSEAENSAIISYEPERLDTQQRAQARQQRNQCQPEWTALVEEMLQRIHRPDGMQEEGG